MQVTVEICNSDAEDALSFYSEGKLPSSVEDIVTVVAQDIVDRYFAVAYFDPGLADTLHDMAIDEEEKL